MHKIAEWQNVDAATFHEDIVPANRPALIRSLVTQWPAVEEGRGSPTRIYEYLRNLDAGKAVYTIAAPPSAEGRFFYSDDLLGLNFRRGQIPLAQVLGQLLAQSGSPDMHSIAVQSLPVREALPGFESDNPACLVDASVPPTMWIGNQGKVAPHYDVHRNLACVVAGRRQFILYPPGQIANLYLGPVLNAPGGVPISLVDVWEPDLEKFPRYSEALEAAHEATLEPGDAIYIPSLWWHAVASLEPANVLVNYWWGGLGVSGVSPNDSLLHAMLTIASLDSAQRQSWREYFDHYVFRSGGDPAAHLPDGLDDITTSLSPEQARVVTDFLSERLKKPPANPSTTNRDR